LVVRFYDETKPEATKIEGRRTAYLYFKTKDGKKRESMAIEVPAFDADNFGSKSEHEFLNALIADYHDGLITRCANKEVTSDEMESKDFMVKDYFDTSRDSSGRKVTKELIGKFYDEFLAPVIVLRALQKQAQATPETIANIVNGYSGMFQKFTKYDLVNAFTEKQVELLKEVFAQGKVKAGEEAKELVEWFDAKFKKIAEAKAAGADLEQMI
jgi:hypothetical protein